MQFITNFAELTGRLSAENSRKRVAVACPHDEATQEAIQKSLALGIADFILVGRQAVIDSLGLEMQYPSRVSAVYEDDNDEAARKAVKLVREGQADVLMKGLLNTDNLLRAILNKEFGLLPPGGVLSHLTCAQIPGYGKLLFFSDAAVIPFPTLAQRKAMVKGVADTVRALGVDVPKIALIHCSEKLSPKFPVTQDYTELKQLASEGAFGPAVVDGPMDVKTACDPHSGEVKGIASAIGGYADALILPDIEAGNVFYKTITCFAHSLNAGMLLGTIAPVVLPSRSDSTDSKIASLSLACIAANKLTSSHVTVCEY